MTSIFFTHPLDVKKHSAMDTFKEIVTKAGVTKLDDKTYLWKDNRGNTKIAMVKNKFSKSQNAVTGLIHDMREGKLVPTGRVRIEANGKVTAFNGANYRMKSVIAELEQS